MRSDSPKSVMSPFYPHSVDRLAGACYNPSSGVLIYRTHTEVPGAARTLPGRDIVNFKESESARRQDLPMSPF